MLCNRAGQLVLKLKTLGLDGTTRIVISLLEFIQGLAALASRSCLCARKTISRLSISAFKCPVWIEIRCTMVDIRRLLSGTFLALEARSAGQVSAPRRPAISRAP